MRRKGLGEFTLGRGAKLKPQAASINGLAAAALATFATYLCVSGSVSPSEIAYGVPVALLGAMAVAAAGRLSGVRQRVKLAWLARLGRPSADVVTQVATLTFALAGAIARRETLCASTSRRAFDPGANEDPYAAGRRALVAIGLSIAPASLICERDLDCNELVVSSFGLEIREGRRGGDPCWPL